MAYMSEGKSKKTSLPKGGAPKTTKSPAQSKKNTRVLAEQNGSVSNSMSREQEPFRAASLRNPQDPDRGEREPVSDARGHKDVSEDMNTEGTNVSEPDFAMHHRIREHAYMLFQENGGQHGRDWADWFEAERQLTQEHQTSRDE